MSKDQKEKGGARNFGVFLSQLEEGGFLSDLSEELKRANDDLALHAERHGSAKGKLTIVLELKHLANGTVDVIGATKVALPKQTRSRTTLWTTADGNLSATNPKQVGLPFREVNADGPAKDIASPTHVVREVGNG